MINEASHAYLDQFLDDLWFTHLGNPQDLDVEGWHLQLLATGHRQRGWARVLYHTDHQQTNEHRRVHSHPFFIEQWWLLCECDALHNYISAYKEIDSLSSSLLS